MANVSQITIPNQNGTTSTYDIVDRKSGYITKVLNDEFTSDSINTGSLVVRGDSRFVNEIQGTTSGNAKPSDITNAINALDVSKIGSDTEYITSITEVDGKISATKKTFPTIPTVNNGTLTIQKNGTQVATFTANQSGNSTANITVPTKVSDLTDDVVDGKYLKLTGGTVSGSTTIDDLTAGDLLVTGSASFNSNVTAPTQNQGDNSTKVATTAYVDKAIQDLPEPMIFKGSLGTGGTITSLPTAAKSNEGYTYKVITAGTYASISAKVGDTFISDGSKWVLIPSGDEPSGTVTSVGMTVPTGLSVSGSPITSSGTLALSYASGYSIPTNAKQTEWDGKVNKSGDTMSGKLVVGTAGMNIASGKVSGMTSGTTEIYKDGIAISNPTTANDVAWMRVVGTGENDTVLEIATGDDANQAAGAGTREEIAFRQYTTSNTVAREAKIFDKSGNTSFPGTVTGSKFIGPLQGNADTATKATQDGSGNNIVNTYMPFSGGTFTNANNIKYSTSKDTKIIADASSVLQSPIPKYLWHDIFAFYPEANIIYERSIDGGSTWVAETDKKGQLFINKENQAVNILDTTHNAARFTFNSKISWSYIAWLVIGFTYSNPSCPRDILVESYDSTNEVWRELLKVQNSTSNSAPEWFKMGNPNGDAQLRLTFTKTDLENTASLNISCIKFLSSRWGDQGLGSEIEKPYNWNKAQDIYPNQNNTSNLGSSSYKWANVYATNFVGNADTATTASSITYPATLDTQEKIDNFLTANKFQVGIFKTTGTNNVGMASNDGMILSMPWTSANYGAQLAFDDITSGVMKFRGKATTWGDWRTVIHDGNYTDYTVKKDGTGASGSWSITASNASKLNNQDASYYLNYNNLTNKPSIPAAANNGTLTIQKNGTQIATFGANQSSNATANITMTYPDLKPLVSKKYESTSYYATSGSDWATSSWYFMSVKPDSWYKPWSVKFKVRSYCPNHLNADSVTYSTISGRANSTIYSNWNERYDTGHYYIPVYPLKKAGFDAGYGHAIGISILYGTGYTTADYFRTFEVDYYECDNCTVTVLDTPVKWNAWKDVSATSVVGNTTNYEGLQGYDAVNRGLREYGDDNDYANSASDCYFRMPVGSNGLPAYNLTMLDSNNCLSGLTTGNATTSTTKVKNTVKFRTDSQLWYYNSGTNRAANANIDFGQLRYSYTLADFRYSINVAQGGLTQDKPLYIVGTYDKDLNYFTLDSTWWTQTLPTTDDGKIYIFVGTIYPDGAASTYRVSLLADNPKYWYKNGAIRQFRDYGVDYLPLTGGTVSGSTTIDDLTAGDLLVTGSAKFNNTIQGNINGTVNGYSIAKSVPSNAVFTDHITTATTSGSGNAVTAITADANGALTVTKGTTFLTSHQDISGKANASETGYSLSASGTTVQLKNKAGTVLSTITTQDTNTDTKNTAGSTDTSSKIYLVGATSQAASPQTYSDNQVYATNGQLDANVVRVAEKVSLVYDSSAECLNFVFN